MKSDWEEGPQLMPAWEMAVELERGKCGLSDRWPSGVQLMIPLIPWKQSNVQWGLTLAAWQGLFLSICQIFSIWRLLAGGGWAHNGYHRHLDSFTNIREKKSFWTVFYPLMFFLPLQGGEGGVQSLLLYLNHGWYTQITTQLVCSSILQLFLTN